MCATGTQTGSLFPAMAMLETPMLYDSSDHAHRAMNGETFKLINKGFPEKSGLTMMNAFPLGFRHFYTKKPVKDINDPRCACASPEHPALPRIRQATRPERPADAFRRSPVGA